MHLLSTALLSEGSLIDLDGTMFIQVGIFFVAFFVLRPLIFRPMVDLFEAREAAIEGARRDARRLREQADQAGKSFDEEMRKVRLSAAQEREKLRAEGKRLEKSVLDRVREETAKQMAEADAQIQTEASRTRREMEHTVPTLARQIASKLLAREVS